MNNLARRLGLRLEDHLLIKRLAEAYQESYTEFVRGILETWTQNHRNRGYERPDIDVGIRWGREGWADLCYSTNPRCELCGGRGWTYYTDTVPWLNDETETETTVERIERCDVCQQLPDDSAALALARAAGIPSSEELEAWLESRLNRGGAKTNE